MPWYLDPLVWWAALIGFLVILAVRSYRPRLSSSQRDEQRSQERLMREIRRNSEK